MLCKVLNSQVNDGKKIIFNERFKSSWFCKIIFWYFCLSEKILVQVNYIKKQKKFTLKISSKRNTICLNELFKKNRNLLVSSEGHSHIN